MNTPGQSTVAATLDAIDAATEQRCACGCGRVLAPDGPSAWYATPDCQRDWHEQHATDPDDVYERADAAYVGVDSAAWPLSEPGEDRRLELLRDGVEYYTIAEMRRLLGLSEAGDNGTPYTIITTASPGSSYRARWWASRRDDDDPPPFAFEWSASPGGEPTDAIRQVWDAFAESMAPIVRHVAEVSERFAEACEQLRPYLPEQPPTDPMERALWLRRNRHTGPRQPQRAPRRIDPRRNR